SAVRCRADRISSSAPVGCERWQINLDWKSPCWKSQCDGSDPASWLSDVAFMMPTTLINKAPGTSSQQTCSARMQTCSPTCRAIGRQSTELTPQSAMPRIAGENVIDSFNWYRFATRVGLEAARSDRAAARSHHSLADVAPPGGKGFRKARRCVGCRNWNRN